MVLQRVYKINSQMSFPSHPKQVASDCHVEHPQQRVRAVPICDAVYPEEVDDVPDARMWTANINIFSLSIKSKKTAPVSIDVQIVEVLL